MTLQQFLNLSDHKKTAAVMRYGTCVASRKDSNYDYLVFQIDGFYFEVVMTRFTGNLVRQRAFDDTDELAPYLDAMEISLP
jgi:hypothetical protein